MNRAIAIVLLVSCASCTTLHRSETRHAAHVTHIVLAWLKTPGDESARQKLIETSRTFATIPGVLAVTAGRAIPSTRPVVDSTFDVAVVITFTDKAALDNYEKHPTHVKAVDEVLKPLVAKQVVYDVVDDR